MGTDPKTYFFVAPDKKASIYGELSAGVLAFVIQAEEESSLRGTELFNGMMAYFGPAVTAIKGVWLKSESGKVSTNTDKVNELTAAGMPREEAIHHAWTVTRATKLGFSRVRLAGQPTGTPGAFTKVEVLIER